MFASGEDLRKWRDSLGLSVPQLARRIGLHFSAVYRYENGERQMPQLLGVVVRQSREIAELKQEIRRLKNGR